MDRAGGEISAYRRQPGHGTSYIVGKQLLDRVIAHRAHAAAAKGEPADIAHIFADDGIVPWPLMAGEEAGEE